MENLAPQSLGWACPAPGCKKSFTELWKLRAHYRAPTKAPAGSRGHGVELTRCPRCSGELTIAKHSRHRCRGAPASTAVAPAAAAPAAPVHHTGTTPLQPRKRKRVTWQDYEGFGEGQDAAGSGQAGAAGAAAAAAAAAGEQPARPAAKQLRGGQATQTTPRGAAAAELLMSIHQEHGAGGAGGVVQAAEHAPGSAFKWWQVAVQPEKLGLAAGMPQAPLLPLPSAMVPQLPLAPYLAPAPALAASAPLLHLPLPIAAPVPPAPPPLLATAALARAQPAALQQVLQQAGLPAAAGPALESLVQLMTLLKMAVSEADAQAFVELVLSSTAERQAAVAAGGAGPASAEALLSGLAAELGCRCAAVRHLLESRQGAALANAVRSTLQAARLSAGVSQLLALLAHQEGGGGSRAEGHEGVK